MSKKKLSQQQQRRIDQKQQQIQIGMKVPCFEGLVITRYKNQALVESSDQLAKVLCAIRPDLETVVVGDQVLWRYVTTTTGVIEGIQSRRSRLSRFDRYGHEKVLAANISQMVVVIASKPQPSDLLIDSYLLAAEFLGIRVSIIFNKLDLDHDAMFADYQQQYQDLCDVMIGTQMQHPNERGLKHLLQDQQSVLVGQSGVGKSSLIRLLLPQYEHDIAVASLSERHEVGQHTTTAAFYFHLPWGGALIDSPGVRSFSLGKLDAKDLLWGFREFRPFIGLCKYRDCNHRSDLGCAIKAAVKNLQISAKRYENYVKIAALEN